MLLSSLIALAVLYTVSGENSCYDCTRAPNKFDYIVTLDNIPSEVQNCPVTNGHSGCHIEIRWDLTLNRTEIDFLPDQARVFSSSEHWLRSTAAIFGTGVNRQSDHLSYYSCSTNRCNDVNALKRLFQSMTIRSQLVDLEDLLQSSDTFDGRQCFLDKSNRTDTICKSSDTIDPTTCKQCFTISTRQTSTDRTCASCVIGNLQPNYLQNEVLFNLTDRTRADTWSIQCLLPQCNQLDTGRRIGEKTSIDFNFERFFNHTPSLLPSFTHISLIVLALIIKYAN